MNAREIIREIAALPRNEQVEVIRFVYRLDAERKFSGVELNSLAERLTHTTDPVEGLVLRDAIMRGFYGTKRGRISDSLAIPDPALRRMDFL